MKRLLFTVLALGMLAVSLTGCRASGEVDKPSSAAAQIGLAR